MNFTSPYGDFFCTNCKLCFLLIFLLEPISNLSSSTPCRAGPYSGDAESEARLLRCSNVHFSTVRVYLQILLIVKGDNTSGHFLNLILLLTATLCKEFYNLLYLLSFVS
ncbi:hypothetical protein EGR_06257 [Echinococcus granulosus]|uniref:Uncharacterized protein n=1 Tax=Echinococcus granulosus TaxID=6210 RepID=W6UBQ7_ECHGR|nr:hypothetical protein EGR_06257 [Echinococcus granulosus]EUB58833.1 hypothetical protein EGR_06257 [Echinococcus granulosus]